MLVTRQKSLRRFWYPVMPLERLTGGPKAFTLLGEKLVLFLDQDGAPVALRDRCCHRTAQLSLGWCDKGNIVCGYHGWAYDRTGRCVSIPQLPDTSIPANARTRAFQAASRYGHVWVALDDPLVPIPDFALASQAGVRQIDQLYERWDCSGLRLMENAFDLTHVGFVHRESFGLHEGAESAPMQINPQTWGIETIVETEAATMRATWHMPFLRHLEIRYRTGLSHDIVTCATPVDDGGSMVLQWCWRSDTEAEVSASEIMAFDRAVTLEDRRILESTEADACVDLRRPVECHLDRDRPGVLMREMLLELLVREGETEAHGPSLAEA
jgi:phenylpropionate dioxygenase-like ring-hydroxylating dioxygenase large terminal subunit